MKATEIPDQELAFHVHTIGFNVGRRAVVGKSGLVQPFVLSRRRDEPDEIQPLSKNMYEVSTQQHHHHLARIKTRTDR